MILGNQTVPCLVIWSLGNWRERRTLGLLACDSRHELTWASGPAITVFTQEAARLVTGSGDAHRWAPGELTVTCSRVSRSSFSSGSFTAIVSPTVTSRLSLAALGRKHFCLEPRRKRRIHRLGRSHRCRQRDKMRAWELLE